MSNPSRIPPANLHLDTPDERAEGLPTAVATAVASLTAGGQTTIGSSRWTCDRLSAYPDAFAVLRGSRLAKTAADNAQIHPAELARLRVAYAFGGDAGVQVLLQVVATDQTQMRVAAAEIDTIRTSTSAALAIEDNTITDTVANLQVRYGPDGRWYPFTRTGNGNWVAARQPAVSAADAYTTAAAASRNRQG